MRFDNCQKISMPLPSKTVWTIVEYIKNGKLLIHDPLFKIFFSDEVMSLS